jgi:hypothetical protein
LDKKISQRLPLGTVKLKFTCGATKNDNGALIKNLHLTWFDHVCCRSDDPLTKHVLNCKLDSWPETKTQSSQYESEAFSAPYIDEINNSWKITAPQTEDRASLHSTPCQVTFRLAVKYSRVAGTINSIFL